MNYDMDLRSAYSRLSRALCKQALREHDFGFVDRPIGQLALAMLADGDRCLAAFREAKDAWEARRKQTDRRNK